MPKFKNVVVHAFCDASTKAYGTVLYFVENSEASFVIAKARVAPKKGLSIPKLEHDSSYWF